jgi:hypothetical protein
MLLYGQDFKGNLKPLIIDTFVIIYNILLHFHYIANRNHTSCLKSF